MALHRATQDWAMAKLLESKSNEKDVDLLMISDSVGETIIKLYFCIVKYL